MCVQAKRWGAGEAGSVQSPPLPPPPPPPARTPLPPPRRPLLHVLAFCLHPQTATLVLLNGCLVACILVCATLLLLPIGLPTELLPHIVGLLLLAAALAFSVNW